MTLFLFSLLLQGTQTHIYANSLIKARVQFRLLINVTLINATRKVFPKCPKNGSVYHLDPLCWPSWQSFNTFGAVRACDILNFFSYLPPLSRNKAHATSYTELSTKGWLSKSFSEKSNISSVTIISFKTKVLSKLDFSFFGWGDELDVAGDLKPLLIMERGIIC